MKKQPEVTEKTREDFIHAFCECYMERPIERITVKEVAEKAGYSRVTFYNYFDDVYDLLDHVEEEFTSWIAGEVVSVIEVDRRLDNFLHVFNKLITTNTLYSQMFFNNSHAPQALYRLKDRIIPLAVQCWGIPPENKKARYTFEFYIPGVISLLSQWMKNKQDMSAEELGELIKGILQKGVLSQLEDC